MIYTLPALKYDYDALEPVIDGRTMEIHYTRHHGGYVSNLNKLIELCPAIVREKTLEELLLDIKAVPEDMRQGLRNFGGGHFNHCLFWEVMGPKTGREPSGLLLNTITTKFGSFVDFKKKFTKVALNRFGSGWVWLCLDSKNNLEIMSTPNQDSSLMHGLGPILGIDLWEHAYYLKYQNCRADYIDAWWSVVDWERVAEIFAERMKYVVHSK